MAIPVDVAAFRSTYRKQEIPATYLGRRHGAVIVLSGCVLVAGCLLPLALRGLQAWQLWMLPATFLFANLFEYVVHRWPLHHSVKPLRELFRRHTLEHHNFFTHDAMTYESSRDFKMVLFPAAVIFVLFGLASLGGALVAWILGLNCGLLFIATAILYYLNYEALHFVYHLPETNALARLAIVKRLRKLHTLHHDKKVMSHSNFNITYPLFDWVFGTVYRAPETLMGQQKVKIKS